jgi:DNA invertase Pin-like site-specific DNA recombinase
MPTFIAYYRVSTQGQGQSGLGLKAQQADVMRYVKDAALLVGTFTDVESGKKDNRPQLLEAIKAAKEKGATLVIAKLDRLSRNLTFISSLMDSGVKFTCCDMPEANEFTIHIFAALAQQERKMISERTKVALQSKILKGEKLGTPSNLTEIARLRGLEIRKRNSQEHISNTQACELIFIYREKGLSLQQIAEKLNASGYKTRRGKQFRKSTVHMLLLRTQKRVTTKV